MTLLLPHLYSFHSSFFSFTHSFLLFSSAVSPGNSLWHLHPLAATCTTSVQKGRSLAAELLLCSHTHPKKRSQGADPHPVGRHSTRPAASTPLLLGDHLPQPLVLRGRPPDSRFSPHCTPILIPTCASPDLIGTVITPYFMGISSLSPPFNQFPDPFMYVTFKFLKPTPFS